MSARMETTNLIFRIWQRTGVSLTYNDANTLRRAELALQRWAEQECGDGSGWAIERNEQTSIPYRVRYSERMPMHQHRYRIPDREAGALRRVSEICKRKVESTKDLTEQELNQAIEELKKMSALVDREPGAEG